MKPDRNVQSPEPSQATYAEIIVQRFAMEWCEELCTNLHIRIKHNALHVS